MGTFGLSARPPKEILLSAALFRTGSRIGTEARPDRTVGRRGQKEFAHITGGGLRQPDQHFSQQTELGSRETMIIAPDVQPTWTEIIGTSFEQGYVGLGIACLCQDGLQLGNIFLN